MSEPMQAPILFSDLPLEDAAKLLREIALRLLDPLLVQCPLRAGCCDRAACQQTASCQPPDLASLISLDRASRLAPTLWSTSLAPSYRMAVAAAARGWLSADWWRAWIWSQLTLRLGRRHLKYVPPDFWPTVAVMAWREPYFQWQVGERLRRYLWATYLFAPQDHARGLLLPVLAPETFWSLIALARPAVPSLRRDPLGWVQALGPRAGRWFPPGLGRQVRTAHYLRREAERQVLMGKGWADYWDQWVIAEALRLWPAGLSGLAPSLRSKLLALPILQAKAASDGTPVEFVDPKWHEHMPRAMASQYKAPAHSLHR